MFRYYDPFEEFRLISDNIFRDAFKGLSTIEMGKSFPIYDQVSQEDGSVVLEFPLAGYKQEELDITVEGNKLIISGNKDGSSDNIKGRVAKRSFQKVFTAAEDLNLDVVEAHYENGLLQVKIPSKEQPKIVQKKIAIKGLNQKELKA